MGDCDISVMSWVLITFVVVAVASFMWAIVRDLRGPDLAALAALDPERITVESVAAVLRTSRWSARLICDTAVRRGEFERVGINYRLAAGRLVRD